MSEEEHERLVNRARWILNAALASAKTNSGRTRIEEMNLHLYGYAEPGYPEDAIAVTGNWNDITRRDENGTLVRVDDTPGRVCSALDESGIEIEWSDQWAICGDCSKLVRTSADSYFWQPSSVLIEGSRYCIECLDEEAYLEHLEGKGSRGNSLSIDPSDHSYQLIQDGFQSGMMGGQSASPELIQELLDKAGFQRFILQLESTGQFDMNFSVWLHDEEADEEDGMGLIRAKRVLERGETDGPDPAEAMKRGLKQAGRQADEMRRAGATGTIVSTITPEGVTSREVEMGD